MDADFEERTAARLRAELAEAVPDDLPPPPLPDLVVEEIDDTPDDQVVRLRTHSPLWPFAVAAAVAVIAVAVTFWVRPDPTATTAGPPVTTTAAAATPSTADRTTSPDPNVFWVPMPEGAAERAAQLLAAWDADGTAPPPPPNSSGIPVVQSASLSDTGVLMLQVISAPLGAGHCESQQEVSVVESSTAVVVLVTPSEARRESATAAPMSCTAEGYLLELPVGLSEPLGDRALLDLNRWTAQWGDYPVEVEVAMSSDTDPVPPGSISPEPGVSWVPMPDDALTEAELLLDEWDGTGSVPDSTSVLVEPTTSGSLAPVPYAIPAASVDGQGGLLIRAGGAPIGTGPCAQQLEISVLESDTAVVIFVQSRQPTWATGPGVACTLMGIVRDDVPVALSSPLGDRALLDLNSWTGQAVGPVEVPVTR